MSDGVMYMFVIIVYSEPLRGKDSRLFLSKKRFLIYNSEFMPKTSDGSLGNVNKQRGVCFRCFIQASVVFVLCKAQKC